MLLQCTIDDLIFGMDGVRVGIAIPTIEVRFEGMNVGAEVHVGSRAVPTLTNYMVNKVEVSVAIPILMNSINLFEVDFHTSVGF